VELFLSVLKPTQKNEIDKYRKSDTKFVVKLIISLLIQEKLKYDIDLKKVYDSCENSGFCLLEKLLFSSLGKKIIIKESNVHEEITSTLLKLFMKLDYKDNFEYRKIDLPNLFGKELKVKLQLNSQLIKSMKKMRKKYKKDIFFVREKGIW